MPVYTSIGVFFDNETIDAQSVCEWLRAQCRNDPEIVSMQASPILDITVCYGGSHGEDLDAAASELGIDPAALIAGHSASIYMVAMIGFAPGFPYLAGLDPTLALPRLATPRTRVPAGSVAIGGTQTGIYPNESPGGWRLLGRTPLRL